jgi:simple sugar transport system permease protein
MAIAVGVAFRAGVLNIGMEGQMVMGGLAGALVALYMPGPGVLVMLTALVAGAGAGAAWAMVAAGLQFRPGVPILISSLLLSYPARYLASWVVRFPLKDPNASIVATPQFDPEVRLPLLVPPTSELGQWLAETFGRRSWLPLITSQINWSVVIVIGIVAVVAFANKRTVFGYETAITGQNALFARYGGAASGAIVVKTMALSGGLSGLVGIMFVIGAPSTRLIDGSIISTNYAFTGLLVALLAANRPWPTVVAGTFFGAITAGSGAMSRSELMSPQIAAVIQGIVIVLIALQVSWPHFKRRSAQLKAAHSSRKETTDDERLV